MAQIFDGQIRFGIHAGPQQTTYADYRNLWLRAEAMGYDWVSVFDHFIPIMSDPEGPCFEGLTLLAALAAQTNRIRCGMLVIGNTYRHPAVLAKSAATIDHVSGGRLELGIGAGWWEMEHEEYGIPFHTVGRRIRMVGETAKILRSLWTEHRTTFEGRYYHLKDALAEPKPVQNPLPIWVGGMGEQLTLRVVAESADGWNGFFLPLDAYRQKLDALAGHCRDVGRDPNDIRKSVVVPAIIAQTRAEVEQGLQLIARARDMTVEQAAASSVAGTPEDIAERLMPYVEAGVGDFLIGARPPYNYGQLELFVGSVAPLVRQEAARRGLTRAG